jgi:hypothetical protein
LGARYFFSPRAVLTESSKEYFIAQYGDKRENLHTTGRPIHSVEHSHFTTGTIPSIFG